MERGSAITILGLSNGLNDIFNYIEEFLLKGKYAGKPNAPISLDYENKSHGLIYNYENVDIINTVDKEEFYNKLLRLKHKIEGRNQLVLICDPLVFKKFDMKRIKSLLEIKKHLPIKDTEYVCIINMDGVIPPIEFLEEPLEIHFAYNGGLDENLRYVISLYWKFALRIRNETAIQCVKIN